MFVKNETDSIWRKIICDNFPAVTKTNSLLLHKERFRSPKISPLAQFTLKFESKIERVIYFVLQTSENHEGKN